MVGLGKEDASKAEDARSFADVKISYSEVTKEDLEQVLEKKDDESLEVLQVHTTSR